MPCNCDHMEPTQRERLLKDAAGYQIKVRNALGLNVPKWLRAESKNIYAKDERCETELCRIINELSADDRKALIYREGMADVAAWWERHDKADKAREKREKRQRKEDKERKEAAALLTPRQRKLLGVE